jgi:hypothetical protein
MKAAQCYLLEILNRIRIYAEALSGANCWSPTSLANTLA